MAANTRANSNPFSISMATIFMRFHNHIATQLNNSVWDDETLFQESRQWYSTNFVSVIGLSTDTECRLDVPAPLFLLVDEIHQIRLPDHKPNILWSSQRLLREKQV
ncbi:HPX2 [Cordylochernes scorpioides]|uniref:HPX2 n=1 Tax=Cordylochernes scorpioides TaxID=51811 RepID=A0ABY6L955_9ARAC|nr:HPX2 [Cordylochernes scorpioides]